MAKAALLRCEIPGCGFVCNPDLTNGGQLQELRAHWAENEFRFKWDQWGNTPQERENQMQTGISIIATLWREMDLIMKPALEMMDEMNRREREDPWADELSETKYRLDMANQVKVGRGIAIALYHMSVPYFDNPDDVVRHGMMRTRHANQGQSFFTPGTGSGPEADRLWLENKRAGKPAPPPEQMPATGGPVAAPVIAEPVAPAPVETPAQVAPEPVETPAQVAPEPVETPAQVAPAPVETPAQVAPAPVETPAQVAPAPAAAAGPIAPELIEPLRKALASGFAVRSLAELYGVPVEAVQALQPA